MFVWSLCKVLARAGGGRYLRVFVAWDWVVFVPRVVFLVDTKRGHGEWAIYDL